MWQPGVPAIVIPDGDASTMIRTAEQYHAKVLVLDENHPAALKDIYLNPKDIPGIQYIETYHQSVIYRFNDND